MRIIIPIKQVPETGNVKMDEEKGTMIRTGVSSIINPLDLYSIEKGIALKEELGGEVIVLTMGPPKAEEALREAISMGCDSGYLISDKRFGGSDTWVTSCIIAAAIRTIGVFDLLLFGERATDGDTGQVGPGVASFLSLPIITYTADFTVEEGPSPSSLRVKRLVESGYEEYRLPLPAALSVVKEIAEPRLPTLEGKKRAREAEITTLTNGELKLDEKLLGLKGSPTRVVKISRPKISRSGEMLTVKTEEDSEKAAARIISYLREHLLLEEA